MAGSATIPRTSPERISYDPYGKARHHRYADLTGDGGVDGLDLNKLNSNWGSFGTGDLNRDGTVDGLDLLMLNSNWGAAEPHGRLSHTSGTGATDNIIGYAGYIFNAESPGANNGYLYTVRHRHYEPGLGRWLERDPNGYVDGMGLYEYVASRPLVDIDPFGLSALLLVSIGDPCSPPGPNDYCSNDEFCWMFDDCCPGYTPPTPGRFTPPRPLPRSNPPNKMPTCFFDTTTGLGCHNRDSYRGCSTCCAGCLSENDRLDCIGWCNSTLRDTTPLGPKPRPRPRQ